MESEFELLLACRENFVKMLNHYSNKELNTMPRAYNNNLFWNIAHSLTTQQLLHYYLSGNSFKVDSYWIEHFKKGTSPEFKYDKKLVENLKSILIDTVHDLKEDYNSGLFKKYNPYSTSFGYEIKTIEDAIKFNNLHESMHLGYCLSLKNSI